MDRELNVVLEVIYRVRSSFSPVLARKVFKADFLILIQQRREAALLKNQGWLPIFKGENGVSR